MKRFISILLLGILMCQGAISQDKNFSFKFYGRIRADLFYNSRASAESIDGLFFQYPLDHNYDADGKDLNAGTQGNFYVFCTRLGVDMKGPKLGKAATSAKVEIDFRGSGTTYCLPRIRHAYLNLDWGRSNLLIGQTWHPMFGEIFPSMLNLSTGSPFQPFSRSPMLRYKYQSPSGISFTGATVWQMQYASAGPDGRSSKYIKYSGIPEIFLGVDYSKNGFSAGIGAEMLTLKPRLSSTVDGVTYKVNERVTSFSAEAHLKYKAKDWEASAKTCLANNMTQTNMLGGFAVTETDPRTGEKKYVPFRHSMTWLNFVYGKKWQPGVFFGYLKNLGTGKAITGEKYGTGLDVGQLFSSNWQLTYNLPFWKIGLEFEASTAWYGNLDKSNGKIFDTHSVTNYRVVGVLLFIF